MLVEPDGATAGPTLQHRDAFGLAAFEINDLCKAVVQAEADHDGARRWDPPTLQWRFDDLREEVFVTPNAVGGW